VDSLCLSQILAEARAIAARKFLASLSKWEAGGDPTKILELVEEPLDEVARTVEL
jgi:hypothetical protein